MKKPRKYYVFLQKLIMRLEELTEVTYKGADGVYTYKIPRAVTLPVWKPYKAI